MARSCCNAWASSLELVVLVENPRSLSAEPMQSRSRSMKTILPEYSGASRHTSAQLVISSDTRSAR